MTPFPKLKIPFQWQDRHVLVEDRVWYVPDGYSDLHSFTFPGWEDKKIFSTKQPICIEYCSGNGDWLAAQAKEQPHYNWVGIEKKFDRARRIWSKSKRFNLNNLLTVCGEGYRITSHYLPNNSIYQVFINFPDPWPKKRHEKHRVVRVGFLQEIYRILEPGGKLTLVTDDIDCSQYMLESIQQLPNFIPLFPYPYYILEYPNYGTSYFEDLWRQKGKSIRYHMFYKREEE